MYKNQTLRGHRRRATEWRPKQRILYNCPKSIVFSIVDYNAKLLSDWPDKIVIWLANKIANQLVGKIRVLIGYAGIYYRFLHTSHDCYVHLSQNRKTLTPS